MARNEHQKHPPLVKPKLGRLARNEITILGTSCDEIQQLAIQLQDHFSDRKIAYIDADHNADADLKARTSYSLVDHIGAHSLSVTPSPNDYSQKIWLQEADMCIVNGNHFEGEHQIVVLREKKFESLGRKLDRLTNVVAFLIPDEGEQIPDFLKTHLPDWKEIPRIDMSDLESLISLIDNNIVTPTRLKGLILSGGRSTRMGQDKGSMVIHQKSQREHVLEMISPLVDEAFISCRADQLEEIGHLPVITDRLLDMGPMGAIISAFMVDPNAAWLVLACDLPKLDREFIQLLIDQRDPWKFATAYESPFNGFPEPLVAIWEPKSYPRLMSFLALGHSCPRKMLINSDVNTIQTNTPEKLANVNTPEELKALADGLC